MTPQRTKVFARVIGPYVAVFTTTIAIRLPDMTAVIGDLFASPALVWTLGAVMLAGGLVIIGGHRHWRGAAAITVSLFGWFVALRGLALIASTSMVEQTVQAVSLSSTAQAVARIGFALLAAVGLWLAWVGWFSKENRVQA
ncbi:hypothetical protein [Nonomuraea soli]|uniref:Uncharacterized protein n=1 Tax=Nonomuraea soli TaxID=1032476 RepID=A0A7W0CII0_9ACTN|nr:hypothetical protein [Nonomuraea soli]MBA2891575.1 hypothetical protein [Nonomuraea soli]